MSVMIRGRDILVLLALIGVTDDPATVRALNSSLGLGLSPIHRALVRLGQSQLIDEARRPLAAQVDEFLFHSAKYLFPPEYSGETRGIPTAWAAPPLSESIAQSSGLPPVWPDVRGKSRGVGLKPFHEAVPGIALQDPELHARLAVFDALRAGDARIRERARDAVRSWLEPVAAQ